MYLEFLEKLLDDSQQFADIAFQTSQQCKIEAHRFMLAARCPALSMDLYPECRAGCMLHQRLGLLMLSQARRWRMLHQFLPRLRCTLSALKTRVHVRTTPTSRISQLQGSLLTQHGVRIEWLRTSAALMQQLY